MLLTCLLLQKVLIPIDGTLKFDAILKELIGDTLPEERRELVAGFIEVLYEVYVHCHFTYLEINPLVVVRTAGP